jgi:hypothetical protein
MALAQKVPVLGMLHLVIFLVSQHGQGFMCSITDYSLERQPRGGSLNHLAKMEDTIGHRPLIKDHPYVSEIGVPPQQTRGSDEKRQLSVS